ncbi:MAG: hypothetical protein WCT27_00735 [Patescibacteria group bacterium]
MSIQGFLENLKALGYTICFPVGCFQWINNHWNDKKMDLFILMLFGIACIVLILRSIFGGYLAEHDPFWKAMLIISAIAYVFGIIVFGFIGGKKYRQKYLMTKNGGTPETGQNAPL